MPVGGENSGNFMGLKGENCTLLKIRGVKVLEDENGLDILKVVRNSSGSSGRSAVDVESALSNIIARLDALEKYVQENPPKQGIQGPRGKDGAKSISEMTDVNLDGLDDNGILTWSSKDKKWVVSFD